MDYNKIILVGRVGKDPEVRQVGGKNVSGFSLATTRGFGDKAKTTWHNVQVWDKQSDNAQQFIHKGDRVLVEGSLDINIVGEGEARKTFVQVNAFTFINLSPKAQGAAAGVSSPAVEESDIPF